MSYGVNFRLDYCDILGRKCRVDILKKDYTGLIIPFTGSASPFSVTYKNENDDKFSQITTSEATIGIIANEKVNLHSFFWHDPETWADPNKWTDGYATHDDIIDLDVFYTEDERGWLVRYYCGDFIANNWDDTREWDDLQPWEGDVPNSQPLKWTGYVMPDSSNEPFLAYPYPFELKAKDTLGTLKDIPYSNNGVLIKKVDSLKNILGECLSHTDLSLNFVIGVNTYETSMESNSLFSCPLQQTYIDTNRFIDTNNKPYSVYDVISHLCDQFSANLIQANGKWYFVDVTEKAKDWFYGREYSSEPGFPKIGLVYIDSEKTVLPEQLVTKDHSFEKEPAYKTVSTYYQYGYLTNQVTNGDFNVINPAPLIDPFPGWTQHGGLQVGYGQKSVLTGAGETLINDYYLKIFNNDYAKWLESDPVTVLKTNTIALSLYFGFDYQSGTQPVTDKHRVNFYLKLTAVGQPDMYWNKDKYAWVDVTQPKVISFSAEYLDFLEKGATVNMNTSYPMWEGQISIMMFGVCSNSNSTPTRAVIDDVKITLDESEYYKSPIGLVDQLVNVGNFSKSPDATVLLFGDDANKNRTSWMRTLTGGVFTPTASWFRKSDGSSNAMTLQKIVARNILSQHRTASRRFEGSLMGDFSPLDTLKFPLKDGKFMFMSGTFDAKTATAKVVYSELFTGPFTQFNETPFEDFGDFKDAAGSQVGSSSGVSIPAVTTGGTGSLSSISITVPLGLNVNPDEITTAGTFALTLEDGYEIPTTEEMANKITLDPDSPMFKDMDWYGTQDQYEAIAVKRASTDYHIVAP